MFVFLSLEISPQCYEVNLAAFAYNMHITWMCGRAKETAFLVLKDQFSLKIGIVFWGKEEELYLRGLEFSLFLISDQKYFSNQIQSWY